METYKRYLTLQVKQDLIQKMVFLSGPRQVGKTTLALSLLGGDETHPGYFNWDSTVDRNKLIQQQFPANQSLIVLDEIHKYARWRNWLKGLYDKTKSKRRYLITGSARLDYYRRGGDALTGRYYAYRLHPLTLGEVDPKFQAESAEPLLKLGGFPEPFYSGSEQLARRWRLTRLAQVLREDLRDLERVHEISLIQLLSERIPQVVGSPLSINSLREDLNVAHQTIQLWVNILERLYVLFRIPPFGAVKIRAVKKENKAYLWDWASVEQEGPRFENMVASHLLKYCHFIEDTEGYPMELRYIRDTDKREVDFVVLKNKKPLFAVECHVSETNISPSIPYFAERTSIPYFYQVHLGKKDYEHATLPIRVLPFHTFVKTLELP